MTFALEKTESDFERAMLIFSIDVDAGKKGLGSINHGKNDSNVHNHYTEDQVGEIEQKALPLLVNLFNSVKVSVTFAIRGQFAEIDDYFIPLLLNSTVRHDIGGHGYSHRDFQSLSRKEVEYELSMLSSSFEKFGIKPQSFVFPRNLVGHLDLLEEFGYKCYREGGNFLNDGMYIEKRGRLYDVHPSLYLNENSKVAFLKKILDIAIKKRVPLHFWFHPWNFGENESELRRGINQILKPFLEYAKTQEEIGKLTFETMLSAARKADCL